MLKVFLLTSLLLVSVDSHQPSAHSQINEPRGEKVKARDSSEFYHVCLSVIPCRHVYHLDDAPTEQTRRALFEIQFEEAQRWWALKNYHATLDVSSSNLSTNTTMLWWMIGLRSPVPALCPVMGEMLVWPAASTLSASGRQPRPVCECHSGHCRSGPFDNHTLYVMLSLILFSVSVHICISLYSIIRHVWVRKNKHKQWGHGSSHYCNTHGSLVQHHTSSSYPLRHLS